MSDIFQEVDEEVRREQLKKLWERYGTLLIAACVLLVVAVGGWRTYEWWEAKKAAEAGTAFQAAVALASEGKNKEAEEAFAQARAERHVELPHARQVPRGRRSGAPRPERGGCDL